MRIISIIVLSIFVFVSFTGCEDEELIAERDDLQLEVTDLEEKIAELIENNAELETENKELKQTAEYHFRQGVEKMSNNDYEGAVKEFNIVLNQYPESAYEKQAKDKLKETKELIAEDIYNTGIAYMEKENWKAAISKFEVIVEEYTNTSYYNKAKQEIRTAENEIANTPLTLDETVNQWYTFRNNPDKYEGAKTTWKLEVSYISSGSEAVMCSFIDYPSTDDIGKSTAIIGPDSAYTYQAAAMLGMVPQVRDDDIIIVTGTFAGVSADGVVMIRPIKIKNLGVQ